MRSAFGDHQSIDRSMASHRPTARCSLTTRFWSTDNVEATDYRRALSCGEEGPFPGDRIEGPGRDRAPDPGRGIDETMSAHKFSPVSRTAGKRRSGQHRCGGGGLVSPHTLPRRNYYCFYMGRGARFDFEGAFFFGQIRNVEEKTDEDD